MKFKDQVGGSLAKDSCVWKLEICRPMQTSNRLPGGVTGFDPHGNHMGIFLP